MVNKNLFGCTNGFLLQYASIIETFINDVEGYGASYEVYVGLEEVIRACFYSVYDRGFYPTSEEFPTYVDVGNYFFATGKVAEEYQNWQLDAESIDKAYAEFVDFWTSKTPESNFDFIIKQLMEFEAIEPKNIRFIAGAVGGFVKMENKETKDSLPKKNEWFGGVKERITIEATLVGFTEKDGYYGWTGIHRFVDDEGRTFVWFASSYNTVREDVNKKFIVTGTVKRHDEWNDMKQTILVRVKMKEIG